MKKILIALMFCCTCMYSMANTINVSTGLNNSQTAPLTLGALEPNWSVNGLFTGHALQFNGSSTVNYYTNYWQPTPISSTNAQWIGSGTDVFNNTPGNYVFERTFNVPANTATLACNFSLAWDDDLVSGSNTIQLVGPGNSPVITIPVVRSTSPTGYYLSTPVTNVVNAPLQGTWKIRATINYYDGVGGFLVSGNIDLKSCATNISTDTTWKLAAGSPAGPNTHVIPPFGNFWQPTPVANTGANWIGPTTSNSNNIPGNYIFEKQFTTNGTFSCDFAVAFDDDLVPANTLQLIGPNNSPVINLPVTRSTSPTAYYLSNQIKNVICNQPAGIWTLRATVNYADNVGGFLLSGYINSCTPCDSTCKLSVIVGGLTGGPFTCGQAIGLKCGKNYDFNPQLKCTGKGCSSIFSAILKDAQGNIPAWATSFVANNGAGGLSIPAGITGSYTILYKWGINGNICDSCTIKIKINCPACSCGLTNYYTLNNAKTSIKCSDSLLFNCSNSYKFFPTLNCYGDITTHLSNIQLVDASNNTTPVWALTSSAAFFTNLGNGTLTIPAGVSGLYKLTYQWSSSGNCDSVCGSCTYFIKIKCCNGFTVDGGKNVVICGPTTLSVSVSGGTAPFTYNWSPAAGLNSTIVANPTCNAANTYTITVTDAKGCVQSDTLKTVSGGLACKNATAKQESNLQKTVTQSQNRLKISPNPFNNEFKIDGLKANAKSLRIYTADGKIAAQYNSIVNGANFGKGLLPGVYIVKVYYTDNSSETTKIVKN